MREGKRETVDGGREMRGREIGRQWRGERSD